ncbi:alpha-amylase family glycosyl hydrolase [Streptomyces sp. M10(2022)]
MGHRPRRLRGEARPRRLLHVRRGLLRRRRGHLALRHPGPPGRHARLPFQEAARQYASQGAPAPKLAAVYGDDYRYTTDKANAYEQVTFLGNHDMGRIGTFLKQDNPKADDAELLDRARLANELMFLGRGNPVIYYGDEQGYTGAGGDKDARQTLFASKTADYLDDDQLGTDRTHASDAYDTKHPLYRSIAALSKLTEEHPALRDGVQTERYAKDSVYAFAYGRQAPVRIRRRHQQLRRVEDRRACH